MKIVQINATYGSGSTGKICASISSILNSNDIENYILFSTGISKNHNGIRYMSDYEVKLGALESRILGNYGFNSSYATKKLIRILSEINPDIIHLHNIHNHNCNIELLLSYIKGLKKKVIWTFHDCWAFTGTCSYFSFVGCEEWKYQCQRCPKAHDFSWFRDTGSILYSKKKNALKDLNLTIISPSEWLAGLVKESFLADYPVRVIRNGIDLDIFKPTLSNFRMDHGLQSEDKIILGVGFEWGQRKGLDIFIELSKELPKNYKIVLVGTNEKLDKLLPKSIISVHRTNNQEQLAGIYSIADVFVNPTREDNYPTVNMEALACGTPVITFNTGGSPEMLDETCGIVVDQEDIDALIKAIRIIVEKNIYSTNACLKKAREFDQNICFQKYLDLYRRI